jgi:hypothetical protein
MWANSVWGLFGLSASCLLTMLGLAPDSTWQPILLAGAVIFLTGSVGVLSWPLREAEKRAEIAAIIIHPKRALRLIEPLHIIILGLILAAAGTLWQWRRVPQPDPRIAQLESQIDILNKRLAVPPPTTPLERSPDASRRLLPRDVQRLLEALGEATDLGENSISPTLGAIQSWAANWKGVIRNGNGEAVYVTGRDSLKRDVWDKIDTLLAKFPTYQMQLQTAFALEIPAAKNELSKSLDDAINTVKKYPKNAPPDMDDLLEPRFRELIKQSNLAWNWWSEARQRIREMTANLKDRGVAEFSRRQSE